MRKKLLQLAKFNINVKVQGSKITQITLNKF